MIITKEWAPDSMYGIDARHLLRYRQVGSGIKNHN